jgi:hypothetical protein
MRLHVCMSACRHVGMSACLHTSACLHGCKVPRLHCYTIARSDSCTTARLHGPPGEPTDFDDGEDRMGASAVLDSSRSRLAREPMFGDSRAVEVIGPAAEPKARETRKSQSKGGRQSLSRRDSEGMGMCGFSEEECMQLLAAGIRPWDENASAELESVLAQKP